MSFRRSPAAPVTGSILEVFRIALPLILSNSCHAVNMFVDRLMLARHSQEAVAALTGCEAAVGGQQFAGVSNFFEAEDFSGATKATTTIWKKTPSTGCAESGVNL